MPSTESPVVSTLRSYGGLFESSGAVYSPGTAAEIRAIYDLARAAGLTIAFQGSGYSFDAQAMGRGIFVSLRRFAEISVDAERAQVTVGAGAVWGDILVATEAHGLVPAVMVSTSFATAGGTLAACCMSRFSPAAGKEGKWIARFTIVTPDGAVRQCSRTLHPDLFHAAVGGFGYFGAVVEITYDLVRVGKGARVRTVVSRTPHARDLHARLAVPSDGLPTETVYAAFALSKEGIRTMYCRSAYIADEALVPMMPHQPELTSRLLTELVVQLVPPVGQMFWNYAYDVYLEKNDTYVDTVHGYTFFMDGNVRARSVGAKVGLRFRAIQQTFVIPLDGAKLDAFLAACKGEMEAAGTPPAMIDALCLPADEPFLLSSTRGLPGYAVSVAFESLNDDKIDRVRRCLEHLSAVCSRMGGRVHLTKNVLARSADVRAMYADVLDELFAVKNRYDPEGLLANDFIERLFSPATSPSR